MTKNKQLVSVLAFCCLLLFNSCSKKSDSITDAVQAPYGSTVDMGEPVDALTVDGPSGIWFVEYRIFVFDSEGSPMNGIGINLSTSTPYAVFANSGTSVDVTKTDLDGSVLVVVWVYGGQYFVDHPTATVATFQVWSDIIVHNTVSAISLTKAF